LHGKEQGILNGSTVGGVTVRLRNP
jgi:hypothetical protein